jgi:hypothetical protein
MGEIMNLVQYIPVVKTKKALTREHRKLLFDQQNQLSVLARFNHTEQHIKEVRGQVFETGLKLTLNGYAVPKIGAVFDGLPITTTKHARDLADRIGFVIMPIGYLSDGFRPNSIDARQIQNLDDKLDAWVMAPVTAYSLTKHLKVSYDVPIHVPQDVAQAFMALSMSVPVFRAIQNQLDELRDHIRNYRDRLSSLEREVSALVARMDDLAVQAASERAQRHAEEAKFEKQRQEVLDWYRSGGDPLVLALPHKKTIRDDTMAFIGPCWGELPQCVVKILELKAR